MTAVLSRQEVRVGAAAAGDSRRYIVLGHTFMKAKNYPGKPPRLDEVFPNYESPLFFVTFNVIRRQPILARDEVHAAFRDYCTRGVEMRAAIIGR